MNCKEHSTFHLLPSLVLLFITITQISAANFPINVWPKPTNFHWPHPSFIPLSPTFTISHPTHQHLSPAVSRYHNQILTDRHHPLRHPPNNSTTTSPPRLLNNTIVCDNHTDNRDPVVTPCLEQHRTHYMSSLVITISNITSPLIHGVNESYTLNITTTIAYLTAQTPWGAMRGLETFSQLIYDNPPRAAAGVYISDDPIFPHRGVLLDTSRNYYGVEDLLRLIRAMSMNKLNVFHWHITDSQSFPLVLPSEPELAGRGAYGEDMKYTIEDVKKVVEFGFEHGVRVVPEIDMPGSKIHLINYSISLTSTTYTTSISF